MVIALYWVGESFSTENKPKEAIQFLEEAVADTRNKKYADYTLYALANAYEKTGDYNNAVKYYDQLLTYHKNSTLANFCSNTNWNLLLQIKRLSILNR